VRGGQGGRAYLRQRRDSGLWRSEARDRRQPGCRRHGHFSGGEKEKNLISDACTSDMENKIIIKNEVNNLAADIITKWLS
jgi:hypothetical protein